MVNPLNVRPYESAVTLDTLLTALSSIGAMVPAGGAAINEMAKRSDLSTVVDAINATQQQFQYQPRFDQTYGNLQAVAENPLISALAESQQAFGDMLYENTGSPLAGALGQVSLDALDLLDAVPTYSAASLLGAGARRLDSLPDGTPLDEALIVQHNLTADNLRHADRMGGMPMPSIGIAKASQPIQGYGDITLLAGREMAKPAARNPVYSADAYSPRYPDVTTFLTDNDLVKLNAYLGEPFGKKTLWDINRDDGKRVPVFTDFSEVQDRGLRAIGESTAAKARYLWEKGEMPDPNKFENPYDWRQEVEKLTDYGRSDEYQKWSEEIPQKVGGIEPEEKLFAGYTNAGNRRYKEHNLENVMSEMRRDMKDNNQTSMFGSGALRAQVAPRFRTITDVKNARSRIRPPEELDAIKDDLNNRLIDISDKIGKYSTYSNENPFIAGDVNRERLLEVARGVSSWDEYFPGVPDELKAEWAGYVEDLKNAPTAYFEAKPNRAVGIDEFSDALVPEGASSDVLDLLSRYGLNVETYADEPDRAAKMLGKRNLLFQSPAATVLGGSLAAALLAQMGQDQ